MNWDYFPDMWKDFFYYARSERRAVYVLVVLIALLLAIIIVLPERRGRMYPDSSSTDSMELIRFLAGIRILEHEPRTRERSSERQKLVAHLKEFDPNTADSIELSSLGLPVYVVRNVLKYREKGGRFFTPESFSKIYGLEKGQFDALKPYIRIPQVVEPSVAPPVVAETMDSLQENVVRSFKYPEGTLVDVGVADTTELKKIPGIGSGIAKMVVAYRRRLGGFYHISQLEELDYITPELMKWFKLEGGEIQKISINKASLDRLRAHPYINFYQAKVIIEYRRRRGNIKSLSQLSLYEEFTEKDLERLSHYFTFD